jgi:hypothetical protein
MAQPQKRLKSKTPPVGAGLGGFNKELPDVIHHAGLAGGECEPAVRVMWGMNDSRLKFR